MAVEATNNNGTNPLYLTAGGVAIGGAGGALGTRAVLGSNLKKAMEGVDSFSKSKKAPEVVSALASKTKNELQTAQDDFAAQVKELPDSGELKNARTFLQRLEALKKTATTGRDDAEQFIKDSGYINWHALKTAASYTHEKNTLKDIDRLIFEHFFVPDPEEALRKVAEGDKQTLDFLDLAARLRAINPNNTDNAGIEALREASKAGNQQASAFLDLAARLCAIDPDNENIQDLIDQEVKSSTCIKGSRIAAQNVKSKFDTLYHKGYRTIEDLEYGVKNSPEQKLLDEFDNRLESVQEAKKILSAYEKLRSSAETIAGTADKPGLEATSEALENASKATDSAGIKSSIEGVWGSVKESAESAYKSLNKKTVRNAGILGALGLGAVGYIIAKSQNSQK